MPFNFTVTTDEENVRDYSGNSQFINKSGFYNLTVKNVIVERTANGSEYINLYVDNEGQDQMLYQAMRLTNNDGSPNLGAKLFNKFCIVAGMQAGETIDDPVPVNLPVGKGGEMKECMVLEQFNDTPIIARIQMEYSMYNDKIQETKSIRNFFRYEDKATASEIVNDVEDKGSQYTKEEEYADKVTYKDSLTEEEVQQWLKDRRNGNKKSEETDRKPSTGFSGKRTFGKKKNEPF